MFLYVTNDQVQLLVDSLRSSLENSKPLVGESEDSVSKRQLFAEVFIAQIYATSALVRQAEIESQKLMEAKKSTLNRGV